MVQTPLISIVIFLHVVSSAAKLRRPSVRTLTGWYTRDPCTKEVSNDKQDTNLSAEGCPVEPSLYRGGSGSPGSTITCDIVDGGIWNTSTQLIPVQYWYSVEATRNSTDYLSVLEEKMFRITSENVSWCFAGNTSDTFYLDTMNTTEVNMAKDLGIVSVSSSPTDKQRNGKYVIRSSIL
jgi:hypothetical protein